MVNPRIVIVMAAALALGGCDLTTGAGSGDGSLMRSFTSAGVKPSTFGLGKERATPALDAFIGDKIGGVLDDGDRRLAYDAQLKALDEGAPGAPVPWRNPKSGRYGNIVPGPAYDQKGAQCRGYSHTVTINGEIEIARRTACRKPDGAWSAIG